MKTDDNEIADSKEEQENCDKPMEDEEDVPNITNENNFQKDEENGEDVDMNAEEAAENTD